MNRPHIAWPVRLAANGQILTVDQDSDQDIASCAATCLLWPLGTRTLNPQFGIRDPLFRQGGPDLDEIRTQLLLNDPRGERTVTLDDPTLTDFIGRVTVAFDQTNGTPTQ